MLTAVCATSTTTVGSARRIRVGKTGPLRSSARLASLGTDGGGDEDVARTSAWPGEAGLRSSPRGGASITSVMSLAVHRAIRAYYMILVIYNSLHNATQHCSRSHSCCRIGQDRDCQDPGKGLRS